MLDLEIQCGRGYPHIFYCAMGGDPQRSCFVMGFQKRGCLQNFALGRLPHCLCFDLGLDMVFQSGRGRLCICEMGGAVWRSSFERGY